MADGYYGWDEHAPFDAIVVTAAVSHVPPPLVRQLKPGGRIVIPVGAQFLTQYLMLVEKQPDGSVVSRQVLPVRFVPLTGAHAIRGQRGQRGKAAPTAEGPRRLGPAEARAGAGVGRRAGLRDSAHPLVLDHPVAPFCLHDDQRRAARVRGGRHFSHAAAVARGDPLGSLVQPRGHRVRCQRHRVLSSGPGGAVQSAGVPVGPWAAAHAAARVSVAVRALLPRWLVRMPDVLALRRSGR